jgi:hypothetical protein
MSDDYLWDGSGTPDPELESLERLLGQFRHSRRTPEFPERSRVFDGLRFGWRVPALATLVLALAVAGVWLGKRRTSSPAATSLPAVPGPAWSIGRLEGSPEIDGERMGEAGHLGIGQWLETDGTSRAVVNISSLGQVQIEPNTRLRLVAARSGRQRMALAHGVIHAMIWAAPGQFVVDTPSAVAVDLGCAYTLSVNEQGAGLLRVSFGWVGFKLNQRESFIPEGAVCATRPGVGPGTPYFEDAPKTFRAALEILDFHACEPGDRGAALHIVLDQARQRDALTLWHLLSRVQGSERSAVYDRLATLVPPPRGVTKAGIIAGHQPLLDLWWNQLGYGDMAWWRVWERTWSGSAAN